MYKDHCWSGPNICRKAVFYAEYLCVILIYSSVVIAGYGARCSSVVIVFAHGAMGRRIDPSWGGPIELFLVPASAPQLV